MFNNKRRIASAWAKGLMLGKAVGARDEQERILELIRPVANKLIADEYYSNAKTAQEIVDLIRGESND